jgi:hypothetical protein
MSSKLIEGNIGLDGGSYSVNEGRLVGFVGKDALFICELEFEG